MTNRTKTDDTNPENKTDPETSPDSPAQSGRRRVLKTLAGAGGVLAGGKALPENWSKPLLDTVVVPAQGQAISPACSSNTVEGSWLQSEAGDYTCDIPAGVCEVMVTAVGGDGGSGGGGGSQGGTAEVGQPGFAGEQQVTTFFVTAPVTLSVQVGNIGQGGTGGTDNTRGEGGAGGLPLGEAGSDGTTPVESGGGGGGGGGGSSRVYLGGTEFVLADGGHGGNGGDSDNGGGFEDSGAGGEGVSVAAGTGTGGYAGTTSEPDAGTGSGGTQGSVLIEW